MSDKVVAVVQARMGSQRLPNKMMLWLNGYPVIEWVRRRLSFCTKLDEVVFAVPCTEENQVLVDYLASRKVCVYHRHSYERDDVLGRVWGAADNRRANYVVRVCADNPLVAPEEVDHLVERFKTSFPDYMYNHMPRGNRYPDGLGAEMTSLSVLSDIKYMAPMSRREHVFDQLWWYFWNGKRKYRIETFDPVDERLEHPELKLDLDTYEDYQRLLASGVDIDMTAAEIVECFL